MADLKDIDFATDLTSDIYGINKYVNEIRKKYNPNVSEDTLMLGIYGYLGEMFSNLLQNDIVMASEFSNESIPSKAKFEKNVIAHALGLGMTDINAEPAQLDVLLTFIEDDIIEWAGARNADGEELPWEFTFDKDTPIYIGDLEFHTDYDIIIRKILLEHKGKKRQFAYTAKYLMDIDNPISKLTNPYLTSPIRIKANGRYILFVKCTLHQVQKEVIHKKILADNSISAKTATFSFTGQLSAFTVDVHEGNNTVHMIPVYEGLSTTVEKYPYFYYTYLDSNTIRIKFDRNSYMPRINCDVDINVQTTEGTGGNFKFSPTTFPGYAFSSDKYGYSNIGCEIRPVTGDSEYGTDKKTVTELKRLIPKEALSRGSITNMADLENYFNMLNSNLSKLFLYKKRDNALERLYYTFMVMKDAYNNVIPTNTIDLWVRKDQFQTEESSGKLILKRGQTFRLVDNYGYVYNLDEEDPPDYGASFYYMIPYSFILNQYPLYGMYYLATIDEKRILDFTYINERCLYQFVSTYVSWHRGYLEDPDTYYMDINTEQNVDSDGDTPMIERDDEGNLILNLRCIAVFYNDKNKPYRWAEGEYQSFDEDANIFKFRFKFDTKDYIDSENRIRIDTGMHDIGQTYQFYGHFDANTKCEIYFISRQGDTTDLNNLDSIVPNLDGWTLSNTYTIIEGINFFYDYSEIIESVIVAHKEEDGTIPNDPDSEIKDIIGPEESITYMNRSRMIRSRSNSGLSNQPTHGSVEDIIPEDINNKGDYKEPEQGSEDLDFSDENLVTDPNVKGDQGGKVDPITGLPMDDDGNVIYPPPPDKPIDNSNEWFRIKSVPVVKADYFDEESKVFDFAKEIISRKNYIDYAIQVLEDAFGIDFKFFNTYGPSKLFTLDNELDYVNHPNLTLTFSVRLHKHYDTNVINDIIKDIKDYIEDINEINSLHMPNLITYITSKYRDSLVYFEFVDMNGYGPGVQHLYSMQMPPKVITPEFVNVFTLPDGTPDINLIME